MLCILLGLYACIVPKPSDQEIYTFQFHFKLIWCSMELCWSLALTNIYFFFNSGKNWWPFWLENTEFLNYEDCR